MKIDPKELDQNIHKKYGYDESKRLISTIENNRELSKIVNDTKNFNINSKKGDDKMVTS